MFSSSQFLKIILLFGSSVFEFLIEKELPINLNKICFFFIVNNLSIDAPLFLINID